MAKVYSSREMIKLVQADGWYEVSHEGSHKQFKHPAKPGRVTIPHPERALPKGTAASIFRQARIKPPR